MADIFNVYFSDQSNIDDSNVILPNLEKFTSELTTIEITEKDVEDMLLNLDTSKAIWPDCVSPRLLKEAMTITACTSSNGNVIGAVNFSKIYTSVGITNKSFFLSTGKILCDVPGLYYISSYIRTNTNSNEYYLKKNNDIISKSETNSWPEYYGTSTSVISAVVEFKKNYAKDIYSSHSCLIVMKIK
ncbi:unnamed protein product [Mytilus edulis]|uniref:Uncharacterized protein n=1 Tax=Mytilus edulis TaxID=6550 RepID=A0A8S3Q0Z3_MYTED|nr:unnamed protein product [Mytilus edulis]